VQETSKRVILERIQELEALEISEAGVLERLAAGQV